VFVKGKKRQGYPLVSTTLSQLCDIWVSYVTYVHFLVLSQQLVVTDGRPHFFQNLPWPSRFLHRY